MLVGEIGDREHLIAGETPPVLALRIGLPDVEPSEFSWCSPGQACPVSKSQLVEGDDLTRSCGSWRITRVPTRRTPNAEQTASTATVHFCDLSDYVLQLADMRGKACEFYRKQHGRSERKFKHLASARLTKLSGKHLAYQMNSSDIRIVLVEPSHPGNIGATARAMKNMALDQLVLVRPKQFPHSDATARASGADDVLNRARVVDSIGDAIAECAFVAATTSRDRDPNIRIADVREVAARVVSEARTAPAAVLFGAERTGLTNTDLEAAHVLIRIPANPDYLSLNLSMAVQLVAYELYRARGATVAAPQREMPLATAVEMERLYTHLAEVLEEIDFRDRTQSGTHLMMRIRRFLQRAELDQNEANILRGMLTAMQNRRRSAGAPRDEK